MRTTLESPAFVSGRWWSWVVQVRRGLNMVEAEPADLSHLGTLLFLASTAYSIKLMLRFTAAYRSAAESSRENWTAAKEREVSAAS